MPQDPSDMGAKHPQSQGFTRDLDAILGLCTAAKVPLSAIEDILHARGFATMSLIICIPFIQPVPVPGLSLLFGLLHMAFGLRVALGQRGGLPPWLKRREIAGQTLANMVTGTKKVFAYVERLFRPRFSLWLQRPWENLVGVSMMFSGLALCMPLPPVILFSNSLPAWAIILLCLGYIERDGLFVLMGHVLAIATWIYFAIWGEVIWLAVVEVWNRWLAEYLNLPRLQG